MKKKHTNDFSTDEVVSGCDAGDGEGVETTVVLVRGSPITVLNEKRLNIMLTFSTSVAQYSGLLEGRPISETLNQLALEPTAVVASSTLAMYTYWKRI